MRSLYAAYRLTLILGGVSLNKFEISRVGMLHNISDLGVSYDLVNQTFGVRLVYEIRYPT
jgi:hypothetical protein